MARPPTLQAVQRLLLPVLHEVPTVRPVTEGGEHSTWWVGTEHVLRLALDEDGSERQQREIKVRDALRPRLGLAVPESAASGEWAPGLTYTLDTRLPGASAEAQRVGTAGERDLAELLATLHALPVSDGAALGVPRQASRPLEELRDAARHAADKLAADREIDPASLVWPSPAAQDETPAPITLIHNDLKGEHLLVSDFGRVLGVLDWTDAALADPAEDVGGLAISIGAPAAIRVAELAGYGPPVYLRGLLLARCDTLIRLADRRYGTDDSPLPLLRLQLARAWDPAP